MRMEIFREPVCRTMGNTCWTAFATALTSGPPTVDDNQRDRRKEVQACLVRWQSMVDV